jgi:hypothetical protein
VIKPGPPQPAVRFRPKSFKQGVGVEKIPGKTTILPLGKAANACAQFSGRKSAIFQKLSDLTW